MQEESASSGEPVVDLAEAGGLLEALPDGIALVDQRGTITYVSEPVLRLTGFTRAELVGQIIEVLVPERFQNRHASQRGSYQRAPDARPMGAALDIAVKRKDGSEFPADIALKPIVTAGGAVVMAVIRDVTERRTQQMQLRESQQRMALVEDRERIGRELHDGTIQALFGIGMNLQAAAMATADSGARARMEATVSELDEVIRDLRNYVFGLKPVALTGQPLVRALTQLAATTEADAGLAVATEIDEGVAHRLEDLEATVLQIVREAISNVIRHAQASTCRISLHADQSGAMLEIDDDGKGFDVESASGRGHGLGNLRERARELHGELSVESGSSGTTIRIVIPDRTAVR